MNRDGRPVIVRNLAQARAAVAAAKTVGVPLILRSPPDMAGALGAAVFRRLVDEAVACHPTVSVTAVYDCGPNPGWALDALREGLDAVHIQGTPAAKRRMADIAAAHGARLDASPGTALNLDDEANPEVACRAWLTP